MKRKSNTRPRKISLGLVFSQLSYQCSSIYFHCLLSLHKLSYVAVPFLAHHVQHTDEECARWRTEHALESWKGRTRERIEQKAGKSFF